MPRKSVKKEKLELSGEEATEALQSVQEESPTPKKLSNLKSVAVIAILKDGDSLHFAGKETKEINELDVSEDIERLVRQGVLRLT